MPPLVSLLARGLVAHPENFYVTHLPASPSHFHRLVPRHLFLCFVMQQNDCCRSQKTPRSLRLCGEDLRGDIRAIPNHVRVDSIFTRIRIPGVLTCNVQTFHPIASTIRLPPAPSPPPPPPGAVSIAHPQAPPGPTER